MVQQRGDDEQVEQDGGRGSRGELVDGVQQAALKGGEGDEDEVGECDPGELHRQPEMRGIRVEAGRHDVKNGGRENLAQDQEDDQRQ